MPERQLWVGHFQLSTLVFAENHVAIRSTFWSIRIFSLLLRLAVGGAGVLYHLQRRQGQLAPQLHHNQTLRALNRQRGRRMRQKRTTPNAVDIVRMRSPRVHGTATSGTLYEERVRRVREVHLAMRALTLQGLLGRGHRAGPGWIRLHGWHLLLLCRHIVQNRSRRYLAYVRGRGQPRHELWKLSKNVETQVENTMDSHRY